jgi:hypothetical protein
MTSLIFIIVEKYFKHNNASKSNMNYKNSVRKIFRKRRNCSSEEKQIE